MTLLSCGIDIDYGNSNFHFINKETRKEYYRIVPTKHPRIATMLEEFKGHRIQYAFETVTMARYLYGVLCELPNTEKIHVVHPKKVSEHSSGQTISHGKITKEGDTETRWLLIHEPSYLE